jgi:iron complex outermembrane receptor protein
VSRKFRLFCALSAGLLAPVATVLAQSSVPDTGQADSAAAQRLAAVRVDVTRGEASLDRLPWAVGRQRVEQIRRGQATVGIDEALANIPGVVVANRYNYALDQRVSIRGAGSRANFGLRGVKVLLDGIPQSLPDGQSQLTNVDLAAISKVEVLRGSASSLYGNGSGGVIAFTTDLSAPSPLGFTLRQTNGSFGLAKSQLRVSGRAGSTLGMVSASRTSTDGFRQYSAARTEQLLAAVDHALGSNHTLQLRAGTAATPKALNPGALTLAEYTANRDTAALANVNRGASREVMQSYLSLRLRGAGERTEWSAAIYGQRRFVDNALAVAPPGAPTAASSPRGTFSTLNRRVTGLRVDLSRQLSTSAKLATGLDYQRSFDLRRNQAATGGRPMTILDTLLLDQDEVVQSVGPFAQLQWEPSSRLTTSVGARWDRLRFEVRDNFLSDGADNTGSRLLTAVTGHVGAVYRVSAAFAPYANISTAFETPTTTELQVRPDGQGGFNPELGPQRLRTIEVGARGAVFERFTYELALFQVDASDAIVQYLETAGRAFFRNAGQTRSRGLELGLNARAARWLDLQAAWTLADYRFDEYILPLTSTTSDTLDGNRLAGVPKRALRLGARSTLGNLHLDADHSFQSDIFGDDRNLVPVKGWGDGQLNLRASYTAVWRGMRAEPFISVQNALDAAYVGAVTLNGAFGRVHESAPLRNWYFGLELGAPIIR